MLRKVILLYVDICSESYSKPMDPNMKEFSLKNETVGKNEF